MAFEERAERCWDCKYLIQTPIGTGPAGLCARKAPTKLDQIKGESVSTVYPSLSFFQSIIDAEITFCSKFTLLIGDIQPPGI